MTLQHVERCTEGPAAPRDGVSDEWIDSTLRQFDAYCTTGDLFKGERMMLKTARERLRSAVAPLVRERDALLRRVHDEDTAAYRDERERHIMELMELRISDKKKDLKIAEMDAAIHRTVTDHMSATSELASSLAREETLRGLLRECWHRVKADPPSLFRDKLLEQIDAALAEGEKK